MEIFQDIVNEETNNMRMDRYLKKMCPNESMSRIYQGLKKGDIKVNNKKIKENYRLNLEDIITIKFLKVEIKTNNKINDIIFDENKYKKMIIFENEDFFIVNKRGNIPMHKGSKHKYGLSEIYKKIFNNPNINFANRLDLETSGLVIGCKTMKFLRYISEKIKNNEVEKKYITLVNGNTEEKFTIENYLLTTETGVKVVDKNIEKAKKSISKYKKININKFNINNESIINEINKENRTLLEVELITGRKHQIRVQLSNIGNSIIGDKKYGKDIRNNKENKFYLCCYCIKFDEYNFLLNENIFL